MIADVKSKFPHLDEKLQFAVGSQISVDIFPKGCDKRTCLAPLKDKDEGGYEEVHFFGDKVFMGGNDFEIYNDERVTSGFHVNGPQETNSLLNQLFLNDRVGNIFIENRLR
jgi:phosphomannomutase